MHNNYYFLRQLSPALQARLGGYAPAECFSQNKNELIIGFAGPGEDFYIKAVLDPSFCCLSFPEDFHRSKRNSVDLFPEIIGKSIKDIKQYENERAFSFLLEDGSILLFKMHGNRSNIILFAEDGSRVLFRNKLHADTELNPATLDRPIDRSREAFAAAGGDYRKLFPTFGPRVKSYLAEKDYAQLDEDNKYELLISIHERLLSPKGYYTCVDGTDAYFSLLAMDKVVEEGTEPVKSLTAFYYFHSRTFHLQREQLQAIKLLEKKEKGLWQYLEKTESRLDEIKTSSRYEEIANILMANLHAIQAGQSSATLYDFYREKDIKVKLKQGQTPQKQAETLYRKAKNQKLEIQNLEENIAAKQTELEKVSSHLEAVRGITSVKELRKYISENSLVSERQVQEEQVPYKHFSYMGYDILIGKNSKSNDELTQRYAAKEDLWLHARDVPGSHVVVRNHPGKVTPQPVVEKAAALAAWYSKRKTDSLCPVIVTQKKFVRKRKGAAPGQVVVDKEDVIMIEPSPMDE
ncbi:MAG: NFACT RNA binding domain-containing protein [Cyclobacteriaceae bacterium]